MLNYLTRRLVCFNQVRWFMYWLCNNIFRITLENIAMLMLINFFCPLPCSLHILHIYRTITKWIVLVGLSIKLPNSICGSSIGPIISISWLNLGDSSFCIISSFVDICGVFFPVMVLDFILQFRHSFNIS